MADFNGKEDTSLRDALTQGFAGGNPEPVANPPLPADTNNQAAVAPQTAAERARDEAGRFAPKDAGKAATAAPVAAPAPSGPTPAAGAPLTAQPQAGAVERPLTPPPGFSPTTKAAWDKPTWDAADITAFKKDIAKRETEIEKGFAKLRDYNGLDPFVEMARNSGTTLPEAVQRYVQAEQLLETEPVRGLLWLCQNYGVDPRQLAAAASGNGQQINGQQSQPQPGQQQPQIDLRPALQPLVQEIQNLRQIVYGDKQASTQQTVSAFFADPAHKFAENVADQMAALITHGMATDLSDAYDKACGMSPEIRQILINEGQANLAATQAAKAKQVATQARQAGASITGGLGAPNSAGTPSPDNLRATLEDAFANAARV